MTRMTATTWTTWMTKHDLGFDFVVCWEPDSELGKVDRLRFRISQGAEYILVLFLNGFVLQNGRRSLWIVYYLTPFCINPIISSISNMANVSSQLGLNIFVRTHTCYLSFAIAVETVTLWSETRARWSWSSHQGKDWESRQSRRRGNRCRRRKSPWPPPERSLWTRGRIWSAPLLREHRAALSLFK